MRSLQVCCKVSLYKNCQQQSCSAINRLSSGINTLAGVAPFPWCLTAKGRPPLEARGDALSCQQMLAYLLQARCPSCRPINSVKALKATSTVIAWYKIVALFMAALWNGAGHYIFAVVSFFLLFFIPCLKSQRSQIGCLPYFYTWCGRCESRMQVWNVLRTARWKCRTQKIAKNSPSGHHRTTLSGYIFAT